MTVVAIESLDGWENFAECARTERARRLFSDAIDWVDTPNELYYPTDEHRAVCGVCPVAPECLKRALEDHSLQGVWASTTDYMRRQLRRPRIRSRCIRCNSDGVIPENGHEVCLACGISWETI